MPDWNQKRKDWHAAAQKGSYFRFSATIPWHVNQGVRNDDLWLHSGFDGQTDGRESAL